jgi:hypothetical protein
LLTNCINYWTTIVSINKTTNIQQCTIIRKWTRISLSLNSSSLYKSLTLFVHHIYTFRMYVIGFPLPDASLNDTAVQRHATDKYTEAVLKHIRILEFRKSWVRYYLLVLWKSNFCLWISNGKFTFEHFLVDTIGVVRWIH